MSSRSRISDDEFVATVSGSPYPGTTLRSLGDSFPVPLHPESVRRRMARLIRIGKMAVIGGVFAPSVPDPDFVGKLSSRNLVLERECAGYRKALDKVRKAIS